VYKEIFFTNILLLLQERGLSKQDLARLSGVSISFLSDLTNGKANPSLDVMVKIASGLGVPLDWLLTTHDLGELSAQNLGLMGARIRGLPPGFERVVAVLPKVFAAQVRKWDAYYRSASSAVAEEGPAYSGAGSRRPNTKSSKSPHKRQK
jgi:transcriptional regulator with XRE-family HTH domain